MRRDNVQLIMTAILAVVFLPTVHAADLVVNATTPFTGSSDLGDGVCTLDEAVLSANTNGFLGSLDCGSGDPGFDRIVLPAGTYMLLPSAEATVDGLGALREPLQLAGAGADLTVVLAADRTGTPVAVEPMASDVEVSLTGLTLAGDARLEGFRGIDLVGSGSSGGRRDLFVIDSVVRDFDLESGSGGAVLAGIGTVMVLRSAITDNSAINGGGLFLASSGELLVQDSTLSGNVARRGLGGGIVINPGGSAMIVNSTIARNDAMSIGGIFAASLSFVELRNVTVAENTAVLFAGGVRTFGTALMRNSIVLSNLPTDCSGTVESDDYNLVGLNMGCPANLGGDQQIDPTATFTDVLGPLEMNGTTKTYLPLPASPAVDAGDPGGCVDMDGSRLRLDQSGAPRPVDGDGDGLSICDVGSVELQEGATPEENLDGLIEDIRDLDLHAGTTVSLVSKLRNARRKLEDGNVGAALNILEAFINSVEAQRGKKIPDDVADALIAEVQAIIDAISQSQTARTLSGSGDSTTLPAVDPGRLERTRGRPAKVGRSRR